MKLALKPVARLFSAALFSFAITAPSAQAQSATAEAPQLPEVRVVTNLGAFELQLRPDVAPKTVQNFLEYVRSGFYEGTIFHRVIPGFMVQGGGFNEDLTRRQTRAPIPLEASPTLPNLRGTIAMARTMDPDSATSQFFINLVDNRALNAGVRGPGYTVFGKVIQGMGVVDSIANIRTGYSRGMADVPVRSIIIESMAIKEPTR